MGHTLDRCLCFSRQYNFGARPKWPKPRQHFFAAQDCVAALRALLTQPRLNVPEDHVNRPEMNRTDLARKMRAIADQLLRSKGYISPVDVLLLMGRLSKADYERWRFRQVPFLEKVLPGSLNQHQFFLRELRAYARDELKLKPSRTVYASWGKGQKQTLRFTKFGKPQLEDLFSTHYAGAALTHARQTQPEISPPGFRQE